MFVRDKNTQNQYVDAIIQFFTLVKNVQSISKLMQLLRSSINFPIYDYDSENSENHFNFVFIFNLLQIAHKNHARHFCFHQFVNPPLQSIFHLKWKMSSIWRPLPPFRKQIHIQWKKLDYVSSFKFMGIFVSNKSLFSESCYEI